ncbi:hypothetical protein CsSME_00052094 [Camellia sinensis var. sinensis]
MDSSKGVSGIGFDYDTGMFQAPEEWWDNMESINKVCAKFKRKILEHRELMETVFMGHVLLVSTIGPRERNFLKLRMSHLIQCIVWEPSHLLIRYLQEYRKWIQILH